MKKLKNFFSIIQIPIKLILAILLIFGSFEYLNKVFNNKNKNNGYEFRSLPNNSIDVLVLGSSDAQYSFVPSFFYEDTGLCAYVRGTACQPLEVSYEMLKDSLKTQKPKIVILEVFTALPLRYTCEGDSCYVIAEYQMTGKEKYNTINYLPEEKAKEYRNDFINYHNDWRTMEDYEDLLPSNVFKEREINDNFFGYIYQFRSEELPENHWLPLRYSEDIEVELDELDLESLNNIYNLCKENNIKLLLYKTPVDGITQEDQSTMHKVWEWAEEKDVNYIDFVSLASELKFYLQIHSDAFHCYINGASMITGYIADYVNQNYEIKSNFNPKLDYLYKSNVWSFTKHVLLTESDPLVYLKRLENTEGTICLRYNPHNDKQIGKGLYSAISNLGNLKFNQDSNYYAILKDNELIVESNSAIKYDLEGVNIEINDDNIIVNDNLYETKGPISIYYYNEENILSGILKNIDYIPYPWDCDKKHY